MQLTFMDNTWEEDFYLYKIVSFHQGYLMNILII